MAKTGEKNIWRQRFVFLKIFLIFLSTINNKNHEGEHYNE